LRIARPNLTGQFNIESIQAWPGGSDSRFSSYDDWR
jgi:hypothetical protein